MTHPDIRPATPADLPDILRLVHDLAVYEREPDAVEATEADFTAVLFPTEDSPTTFCHVVEADEGGTRRVVGMALWFLTFSTWTGGNGVWLEDLFVRPDHRGAGLGRALMAAVAAVCAERGYARMEWTVLDWNQPALEVYRHLGAEPLQEWTTHRLTGTALRDLAASGGAGGDP